MRQKILAAVLLVGVAVALGWYFLWDRTQGSLVLYGNVEIRQVDVSFRVDGRIAQVLVDEGDSVRAGQELARLDDDLLRQQRDQTAAQLAGQTVYTLSLVDPVWLRVYVDEPQLGRIKPGMAVRVRVDAVPDKEFSGRVGFISPAAEFTPKSVETMEVRTSLVYRLRVQVDDPDNVMRQGMPVTVTLVEP